jgi:hypothetical protein
MNARERNANHELWELAEMLSDRFIQRQDLFACQLQDGRYVCNHLPYKPSLMVSHLKGGITLGVYILDSNSLTRFTVIDIDDEMGFELVKDMSRDLLAKDIANYLETSRRGGHMWLFFREGIPGEKARGFGLGLLDTYNIKAEVFPKQNRLSQGPGSLIRMPFGIHRKTGERYGFISPIGEPLGSCEQQIKLLTNPQRVPNEAIELYQKKRSYRKEFKRERFENVSLLDFISQYVDLRPIASGALGLCPFHQDLVPSFGVNAVGNYWHCFAGCGGGDIVSFWMKFRSISYQEAVKELANMLKTDQK